MSRIAGYVYLILALAGSVNAAALRGTVYDPTGAVIPSAMVTMVNDTGNQTIAANEVGQFGFDPVAPGTYRLEVRSPGFSIFNTQVRVQDDVVLPVFLRLGVVTETVEVASQGNARVQRQAGVSQRVRVGGHVTPVKLIKMPRSAYPANAKERGLQGAVTFRAVIQKDGTVASLTPAADAEPVLVEAAGAALRDWRYQPSLLNGQPVETEALITVNYKLN